MPLLRLSWSSTPTTDLSCPDTMASNTKNTNPKDAIGSTKLPFHLVPSALRIFAAIGLLEGACKYGGHNYRAMGVRASIYYDAIQRHLESYWNGEDADPDTGIPHLASVAAGLAILLDAMVNDKLTDDRPPRAPVGALIRELNKEVPRIKELFKEHSPKHFTIKDE